MVTGALISLSEESLRVVLTYGQETSQPLWQSYFADV